MSLSNYTPILDAMVGLMPRLLEIVIHNIESGNIAYINGSLSKRKEGDPSLLDKEALSDIEQVTYPKINFDGRLIKSVSVVLEDKWLLCINCDVSVFSQMHELSAAMLRGKEGAKPHALFVSDWQERLHASIHDYLQSHRISFEHLTAGNKKTLVAHLFDLGAFNEKKAAEYVAEVLALGRATVFKYLKELRKS